MNIDYAHTQKIKTMNLPSLLTDSYGFHLRQRGPSSYMMCCPFHEDKEPSLSINQKAGTWLWHCFGCHKGGNLINFIMQKENLSMKEAYRSIVDRFFPNGNGYDPSLNPLTLLGQVTDFYHKSFYEDKRGMEYLVKRGIKTPEIYKTFKVGFVAGTLGKMLPLKGPSLDILKQLGILNDEGKECFYNCVVIPLLDQDQNVVGLYGRHITGKKHLYLRGPHKGLFNSQGAFDTAEVILTESVLDALSLYELGIQNVLPCYGTGGFTQDHKKLFDKHKTKQVLLCFDNDKPGATGAKQIAKQVSSLGIRPINLKLPEGIKDPNDFVLAGKTKKDFKLLEKQEYSFKTLEEPTPIEEVLNPEEVLTDEQRQEALKALKSPTLTQDILEDLERVGCIGEDSNKLLGYIVTLSRRLENPLSMIIVSQSGAGKSNLANTLESIVPEEECIHLSRITPQALYYMDKTALKRKVLIIEEKEGSREADYSIRVLQSKKCLRLAVPMKDPSTGRMKTVTFEVEGPIVFIETTTKQDLNPENTSRCFIVYLDESQTQTQKIHAYQKHLRTLEGQRQKRESSQILQKHQNMQRLLKPVTVHIPFVEHIHFPTQWMRTRRDHERFLNLIEAVTFLHQYQRPQAQDLDGTCYIEATLEDYKIAYELARDVFGDCLSELPKPTRALYESLKNLSQEKQTFTRRDLRGYTGLPDHVVRAHLEVLVRMEYLNILDGKNGRKYEYTLAQEPTQSKEIIKGLTTPKELEQNLATTLRKPCGKVKSLNSLHLKAPCDLAGEV